MNLLWWRKKKTPRRLSLEKPKAVRPRPLESLPAEKWIPTLLVGLLTGLLATWALIHGIPYDFGIPARALLVFLCGLTAWVYLRHFSPAAPGHLGKMSCFGVGVLFLLGAWKGLLIWADTPGDRWALALAPFPLVSLLLTITLSPGAAAATVLLAPVLLGALEPAYLPDLAAQLPGGIAVALGLGTVRSRSKLIELGALAGFLLVLGTCAARVYAGLDPASGPELRQLGKACAAALANGIATGFLLTGGLPYLEGALGVVSGLTLLELSDLNRPLLKRLATEAPGTYHHSLIMSQLAEGAAEAVGANSLLARVGALYHDIGKITKPEYFAENENNRLSKHKNLSPTMSTLIIIAHVKDGIELGELYGLPPVILEFIPQHHGTSCVEFFYMQALSVSEDNPDAGPELDRDSFRYPGPKPRTKETAIVLLADSIEAASRTLSEFTPSKIEGLVHDLVTKKLMDGQLNDSPLTFGDLKRIEETFVRTLAGIFHHRVRYPGQEAEEEPGAEAGEEGGGGAGGEGAGNGNGGGNGGNGGSGTAKGETGTRRGGGAAGTGPS